MSGEVSLFLAKDEYDLICSVAEASASDESPGVSEETVLRALIRMLERLDVDLFGVRTEDQLLDCFRDAMQSDFGPLS